MSFMGGVTIFLALLFIAGVIIAIDGGQKRAAMTPSQRKVHDAAALHGPLNAALICPHCQEKGKVHTKAVAKKKGISGAKATGAILTGGLSVAATGLSRKDHVTQAHCRNCSSSWEIA